MTNLPTDVTSIAPAIRRRQLTRMLAVGALAAGAAVGMAVPAQAASINSYHVSSAPSAGARVLSDPRGGTAGTIARLVNGTKLTIDCGVRVRGSQRTTVWHHITKPVAGFIADQYTDTPSSNRLLAGEATCAPAVTATKPVTKPATTPTITPATPAATPSTQTATRGATINYNGGYGGSCVYYAMDRFRQLTGVYPKALGDAKLMATSAASNGWTVSAAARTNSIVIFQPGQNGASEPYGHAAWVEQVSGNRIYIAEMNAPTAWVVSYRWVTPVAGVRYIYAV
jgi:surface antigen